MSFVRVLAVSAVALAATLGLSGCGSMGEHKIGDTAKVSLPNTGSYDVTVTAVEPAPSEVTSLYDTEDEIYFVRFTTKLVEADKDNKPTGVEGSVFAKLEDGTVVATDFDHIDQCVRSTVTQVDEAFASNQAVESCVPVAGDDGKKVVAIRIGARDLSDSGAQVWKIG